MDCSSVVCAVALPEVYPLNQRLKVQQVVGRITGFFTGVYLNHRGFKSQVTPIGSQRKIHKKSKKKHLEVSSRTQCTSKTQGTLAVICSLVLRKISATHFTFGK